MGRTYPEDHADRKDDAICQHLDEDVNPHDSTLIPRFSIRKAKLSLVLVQLTNGSADTVSPAGILLSPWWSWAMATLANAVAHSNILVTIPIAVPSFFPSVGYRDNQGNT